MTDSLEAARLYLKLAAPLFLADSANRAGFEWSNGTVRLYMDGNTFYRGLPAKLYVGGHLVDEDEFGTLCKRHGIETPFHKPLTDDTIVRVVYS